MTNLIRNNFLLFRNIGILMAVGLLASAVTTKLSVAYLYDGLGTIDIQMDRVPSNHYQLSDTLTQHLQRKSEDAAAILSGNIFCPSCVSKEQSQSNEPIQTTGQHDLLTSLPFVLGVTMVVDPPENSSESRATIFDSESGKVGMYQAGNELRAGVSLEEVHRTHVVLNNNGQREYLGQGTEQSAQTQKPIPESTQPSRPPPKNPRAIPGAEQAIQCSTNESCTIKREFINQLLDNPIQLSKQARAVPAIRDGQPRGFKFYGVRPGSLPKLLGLQNGDLISSVNGHDLKSIDGAMTLYSKLRHSKHLSVTIERKGKVFNKEIEIR